MKRRVARAYAWTRNKPGKWRVAPREGCTRNYGCHNRWRRLEEGMEVTMPAVTAETLTLPRLPHPGPELVDRPVVSVPVSEPVGWAALAEGCTVAVTAGCLAVCAANR